MIKRKTKIGPSQALSFFRNLKSSNLNKIKIKAYLLPLQNLGVLMGYVM